jgi:queuine tRNA-ribosyltransferase
MRNSAYKNDFAPVDKNCGCYLCRNFSRAYLRHLFNSKEILALELSSIHNLTFYLNLVRQSREKILEGTFTEWKNEIIKTISVNVQSKEE